MTEMERDSMRTILSEIAELLEGGRGDRHGDWAASTMQAAFAGPDTTLEQFLISNDLWGGAGSVADECFVGDGNRRRLMEERLINLGNLQIDIGRTNIRTGSWVSTFKHWRRAWI